MARSRSGPRSRSTTSSAGRPRRAASAPKRRRRAALRPARRGRGRGRRLGAGARLRPRAQHERLPHPGRAERARRARGRRPPPTPCALRLPRQLGGGMIRFGLNVGYSGAQLAVDMDLVREAERLGFHSVWTAEAYGSDAVTPLAWIGGQTSRIRLGSAIMQMSARTPAMTASTATSLDQLSGGRFLLGLGVSGPQVVEGWHGQPFGKPLTRTREYVEIVRAIWARERPLEHQGEHYQI